MNQKKLPIILLIMVVIVLVWSMINPKDYWVWLLETFPALVGLIILVLSYKRFKLTDITYIIIAIHMTILFVGGHYTYAENPLFEWIKETYNLQRNYYDRLGHFFQGLTPVIFGKELLLRKTKLENGKMLIFLLISIALAISASYELLEWASTFSVPAEQGMAFLGSQGDIWDAQKDMLLALIGAVAGIILFSRIQDKQIKNLVYKKNGAARI